MHLKQIQYKISHIFIVLFHTTFIFGFIKYPDVIHILLLFSGIALDLLNFLVDFLDELILRISSGAVHLVQKGADILAQVTIRVPGSAFGA